MHGPVAGHGKHRQALGDRTAGVTSTGRLKRRRFQSPFRSWTSGDASRMRSRAASTVNKCHNVAHGGSLRTLVNQGVCRTD